MKRFIRFLARVSGVERQIIDETTERNGRSLRELAMWLCEENTEVKNAVELSGLWFQYLKWLNVSALRDQYRKHRNINIATLKDDELYYYGLPSKMNKDKWDRILNPKPTNP